MLGVVEILGERQCGKTTLSRALRPDWLYIDLENPSDLNRVMHDPEFFLQQNPWHSVMHFGTLPIEIKYGIKTTPDKLRRLEKFIEDNHLPFGLLINQSKEAYWLSKTVFQLPAIYL